MTSFLYSRFGGGILALIAAAFLLLFGEPAIRRSRAGSASLRQGATVVGDPSRRVSGRRWLALMRRIGNVMRDRMMSATRRRSPGERAWRQLGWNRRRRCRSSSARRSHACFVVPVVVYLGHQSPRLPDRQAGALHCVLAGGCHDVAELGDRTIRRPYQKALRRGIPDALDLMVVCAEAGLGSNCPSNALHRK